MQEQLIISEIDVERIRAERRINTTFAANQGNLGDKKKISIATEFVNSKELVLTRKFNPHPFVPQGKETMLCRFSVDIKRIILYFRLFAFVHHEGISH